MAQARTINKKNAFIESMKKTLGIVTQSCDKVGISRETYYKWMKEDPNFAKQIEYVQEIAVDFVESKLFQQIQNGDTTASIFYLKTKGKHRGYIETRENINKNTEYKFGSDLDD
jgi:predicted DNA-binding transcriptional regulator AlpA